jgi:putative DNA primase/helicase
VTAPVPAAQPSVNSIDQRAREQFYDDAATAALRKRVTQTNEALLRDPARQGTLGDRTMETIGRMTREELEALAQATQRSAEQGRAVLSAAQKRIEADVELRTGREPVPPRAARYNLVPHLGSREYLFRDKPGTAFTEGWLTLRSAHETPDVIKAMLDRADQRGWTAINAKGSPEFKRQIWIAATARGIKETGHTPTEGDRLAANEERKRIGLEPTPAPVQTGGTVTREPGLDPTRAANREPAQSQAHSQASTVDAPGAPALRSGEQRPASTAPATPGAEPRPGVAERAVSKPLRQYLAGLGETPTNVEAIVAVAATTLPNERVYVGLVTARDYAPYEFKENAKESPYVTLQGPLGKQTVWGVDLPRALDAAGVKTGDSIALEFRGNQPVTVPVQDRDAAGKVVGWHDETVMRNTWYAAKVEDLRAEALRPAPATAPTPAEAANDSPAVAPKAPDRLQTQPVAVVPAPAPGPAAIAPSVAGANQAPSQSLAPAGRGTADEHSRLSAIKPVFKIKDADAPAFAAFDAVLKQKNIPASLHQTLRETFGKELASRQARGETVGVNLFDATAPRAVTPKIVVPAQQKRGDHKISR